MSPSKKIESVLHSLIGPTQSFVCYPKGLCHMRRLKSIAGQYGDQKIERKFI